MNLSYMPLALILVGAMFANVACSSNGSSSNADAPSLEAAARKQAEYLFADDPKAYYQTLSKSCRDQVSYAESAIEFSLGRSFVESFLKVKMTDMKVAGVETRNVADAKGEARVKWGSKSDQNLNLSSDTDKFAQWVFETGRWVSTACPSLSSNGTATATAISVPTATPTPPGVAGVIVQMKGMLFVPKNTSAGRFSDSLFFVLQYTNTSQKDIRAFTGFIVFADLFGREIKRLTLTYDKPLGRGLSIEDGDKQYAINQFIDADQKLASSTLDNLKVSFITESIIFSDGTQVGSVR